MNYLHNDDYLLITVNYDHGEEDDHTVGVTFMHRKTGEMTEEVIYEGMDMMKLVGFLCQRQLNAGAENLDA